MATRGGLTLGGEHTKYTDDVVTGLYTWNICHPNKFNLKFLKMKWPFVEV